MHDIKGVVKNRRIELQAPPDWPDGTEVRISLIDPAAYPDGDAPMTSDEIARTLRAMGEVEPLILTDDALAAIEADRQARREWERAHFNERAEKLLRIWE